MGSLGAAGHGPAPLCVSCVVKPVQLHTRQPARRNYPHFILPWTFPVCAIGGYKSCSRQPPGQLHPSVGGLQVSSTAGTELLLPLDDLQQRVTRL